MPHAHPLDHPNGDLPPSLITQADAEEFRKILKRDFAEEVDLPEAWRRLSDLVSLVRMLLGPLPEDPEGLRPQERSASLPGMAKTEKLLLLTGIPGSGKTEAGQTLATRHGFEHLDMEEFIMTPPAKTREGLIAEARRLRDQGVDLVVTWGFMPGVDDGTIRALQALGFRMVWFDGDRKAALREFLKRGTVTEDLFYVQMRKIASMDLASFSPIPFNTFDSSGAFLPRATIARKLLELV
jgi:hypothetical protein